jgi:hypothetical protein
MSIIASFNPTLPTVNISVTGSSANVAVFSTAGYSAPPQTQVRVFNSGSAVTFIAFGATSSVTATTSSLPIAPNSVEVFTINASNTYIAAIGTSGNTIYFTPGEGV